MQLDEFNQQSKTRAQRYPISCIAIYAGTENQLEAALRATDAVLAVGGLPLLVGPETRLEEFDGLVVAGEPGDITEAEMELVRYALEKKLPYLGSVRGALLLNLAAGGTLVCRQPGRPEVQVHPESRLYDILGATAELASTAAQGVETLAPLFYAAAYNEFVQAFQRKNTPVQAGYLFAPEYQRLFDPRFDVLFHHLVRDGRIYRSRMTRSA